MLSLAPASSLVCSASRPVTSTRLRAAWARSRLVSVALAASRLFSCGQERGAGGVVLVAALAGTQDVAGHGDAVHDVTEIVPVERGGVERRRSPGLVQSSGLPLDRVAVGGVAGLGLGERTPARRGTPGWPCRAARRRRRSPRWRSPPGWSACPPGRRASRRPPWRRRGWGRPWSAWPAWSRAWRWSSGAGWVWRWRPGRSAPGLRQWPSPGPWRRPGESFTSRCTCRSPKPSRRPSSLVSLVRSSSSVFTVLTTVSVVVPSGVMREALDQELLMGVQGRGRGA